MRMYVVKKLCGMPTYALGSTYPSFLFTTYSKYIAEVETVSHRTLSS